MKSAEERPHRAAFLVVTAVLVLSGIAFARPQGGEEADGVREPAAETQWSVPIEQVKAQEARMRVEAERSAQRFLPAFFRYEVGDIDVGVRRQIRAGATPDLATSMLRVPPRPPAGDRFPPRARLQGLEVVFATPGGDRAIVTGSALRGSVPEEFSFEFEYRQGSWRASGVTE